MGRRWRILWSGLTRREWLRIDIRKCIFSTLTYKMVPPWRRASRWYTMLLSARKAYVVIHLGLLRKGSVFLPRLRHQWAASKWPFVSICASPKWALPWSGRIVRSSLIHLPLLFPLDSALGSLAASVCNWDPDICNCSSASRCS